MSQKKKGDVSIANILAMIGLAAYGVISFFGEYFKGNLVRAILLAVGLVAVLAFLLIFSIKAKKAEDNPDKWRIVEWVCLALYIGVVAVGSGAFHRFFVAVKEKKELIAAAEAEMQAIEGLYSQYNLDAAQKMKSAAEEIRSYRASGQELTNPEDTLAKYVKHWIRDLDKWASKSLEIVTMKPDTTLSELHDQITAWNYMKLPVLAGDLDKAHGEAWNSINDRIQYFGNKQGLIPDIERGADGYVLNGLKTFDIGERPEKGLLAEKLQSLKGSTVLGWVVLVLLHLLVLLNYVVAPRSMVVGPGRQSKGEDIPGGGVPI